MTVKVRFICRELVGDIANGEYEIPEESTVGEAMEIFRPMGKFVENYPNFMLFMVNGKAATLQTELKDGDNLMVLRRIIGG